MIALDMVSTQGLSIPKDLLKSVMGKAIWAWYYANQDDVVFTKKVWFATIKLRVRDLRFLVERIAGPETT